MLVMEGEQEVFPDISEALRYFGKTMISLTAEAPAVVNQSSAVALLRRVEAMARQAEDAEKDSRFHFKRATCSAEILGWISLYP